MSRLRRLAVSVPGLKPAYQWLRGLGGLGTWAVQLAEMSRQLEGFGRQVDLLDRDFRRRLEADIPVAPSLTLTVDRIAQASVPDEGIDSEAVYLAFEDRFYDTGIVAEKQTIYVPYLVSMLETHGAGRIVDLGCGRGEFLKILRDAGIAASGVEINRLEVQTLLGEGYDVELNDINTYLTACDDGSLAAIVALQIIEHFDVAYLRQFLELAARKLRRVGATLIIETQNSRCLSVPGGFHDDLTHVRLYPADTIRFYLSQLGFNSFDVVYTSPCGLEYRIPGVPECNYLDYGLVAQR